MTNIDTERNRLRELEKPRYLKELEDVSKMKERLEEDLFAEGDKRCSPGDAAKIVDSLMALYPQYRQLLRYFD